MIDNAHLPWVAALVFMVAFLYSSVGHGGASGYQAVLSFFGVPARVMASTALILNILVAGTATVNYRRAGHFSWALAWPFMATSVPAAFVGGVVHIPEATYALLLGGVLIVAACRLSLPDEKLERREGIHPVPKPVALIAGALIGLLSGMLGIGGGIFLSPLMLLMGWSTTKQAAATSAFFIVVNAVAGLLGRIAGHNLAVGNLWWLIPVAFAGGLVGSWLGAHRFGGLTLRRLLALVLVLASVKLLLR